MLNMVPRRFRLWMMTDKDKEGQWPYSVNASLIVQGSVSKVEVSPQLQSNCVGESLQWTTLVVHELYSRYSYDREQLG